MLYDFSSANIAQGAKLIRSKCFNTSLRDLDYRTVQRRSFILSKDKIIREMQVENTRNGNVKKIVLLKKKRKTNNWNLSPLLAK